MTPDFIEAILHISADPHETSQERGCRLLWRDQAERWARNDNHQDQYAAMLDAVRQSMGQRNG